MSNRITIEFCEADRERIDKLIELGATLIDRLPPRVNVEIADPIQKQLAAIVANAADPKPEEPAEDGAGAPQEATKAAPPTEDTPPEEEKPTAAENEPAVMTEEEAAKGRAQIRAKFIELSSKGKRDDAKAIIQEYAENIPAVPADKIAECLNRLSALGG